MNEIVKRPWIFGALVVLLLGIFTQLPRWANASEVAVSAPYALKLAVNSAGFSLGEKIPLSLTATNNTNGILKFSVYLSQLGMDVRDDQGHTVLPNVPRVPEQTYSGVLPGAGSTVTLQAGTSYTFPPFTTEDLGYRFKRPGTYTASVFTLYATSKPDGGTIPGRIYSNAVQIIVR